MSKLPSSWATAPIGELIELNPKNTCDDNAEVGFVPMPLIGTTYLSKLCYERRQWHEVKKGYTHFADGDVLLGKITPCFENGKAGLASGLPNSLGAGSTEYFVCRPRPTLHPKYLLAYFKTRQFVNNGAVEMTGSVGHKRVPKDYVTETKIPLAPLPEQKRIADKLDSVLARVDACRDRLDRLPTLLKRFRQSILAAATSGRLTEDWRLAKTEPEKNWNTSPLGALIQKIEAGLNVKCDERPPEIGEIGLVKISAVTWGVFNEDESKTLPSHTVVSENARIQKGDFLISRANTLELVGACVLVHDVTRSVYLSDKVLRLVMPDNMKQWLLFVLRSDIGRSQIEALASGNQLSMRNLSQANLKSIEVPLPSSSEITEIVHRVEILFAFADRLEARLASARRQVGQLTPALLAKAFRGELVAQDPADEPAAELLKRLAAQREVAPKAKRTRAKS